MTVFKKIVGYYMGRSNKISQCFQFFRRVRFDNETVDDFVIALEMLVKSCNICQCLKDNLMRDKLVTDVRNGSTSEELLSLRRLDLKPCIDICESEEATMNQPQHLARRTTTSELNTLTQSSRITGDPCFST